VYGNRGVAPAISASQLARAIETALAGNGAERYRANAKALAIKFRSSGGSARAAETVVNEARRQQRHKQFVN
jgi:hypothetical protein